MSNEDEEFPIAASSMQFNMVIVGQRLRKASISTTECILIAKSANPSPAGSPCSACSGTGE
eukprot:696546-Pyramimonas_sp.AAC.1